MFVACGIWCLADVSSVSPSSEQTRAGAAGPPEEMKRLLLEATLWSTTVIF